MPAGQGRKNALRHLLPVPSEKIGNRDGLTASNGHAGASAQPYKEAALNVRTSDKQALTLGKV